MLASIIFYHTFVIMVEEKITQSNVSISLTKATVEKLDEEARKEIRTRSNMVEVLVLEALEARKNKKS